VGTGSSSISTLASTSFGRERFSGSVSGQVSSVIVSVSASQKFIASGTSAVQSITTVASGRERFVGSSFLTVGSLQSSATARLNFTGQGSILFSRFDIFAANENFEQGDVSITLSSLSIVSSGRQVFRGSVIVDRSSVTTSGQAQEVFAGIATTTVSPFSTVAISSQKFIGSVSTQLSSLAPNATAVERFVGVATSALTHLATTASAKLRFITTPHHVGMGPSPTNGVVMALSRLASTSSGKEVFSGSVATSVSSLSEDSDAEIYAGGEIVMNLSRVATLASGLMTFKGGGMISLNPISIKAGIPGADVFGPATFQVAHPTSTAVAFETIYGRATLDLKPKFHMYSTGYPVYEFGLGSTVRADVRNASDPTHQLSFGSFLKASDTYEDTRVVSYWDLSGQPGDVFEMDWLTIPPQVRIVYFEIKLLIPFKGPDLGKLMFQPIGKALGKYDLCATSFDPSTALMRVRTHRNSTTLTLRFTPNATGALSALTQGSVRISLKYHP
jgi:hypothetical protein